MQYGSTDWASWVLPKEAIKHIQFAYVPRQRIDILFVVDSLFSDSWEHGTTTFNTANF